MFHIFLISQFPLQTDHPFLFWPTMRLVSSLLIVSMLACSWATALPIHPQVQRPPHVITARTSEQDFSLLRRRGSANIVIPKRTPFASKANKRKRYAPIGYPVSSIVPRDQTDAPSPHPSVQKQAALAEQGSKGNFGDVQSSAAVEKDDNVSGQAAKGGVDAGKKAGKDVDSGMTSTAKTAKPSDKPSKEEEKSVVKLPSDVTPTSQGFLFLPVTKPNTAPDEGSAPAAPARQTLFFNIEAPSGGQLTKIDMPGTVGKKQGDEDCKDKGKVQGKGAGNSNDKADGSTGTDAKGKPGGDSAADQDSSGVADQKKAELPDDKASNKTRIVFKPLQDPDAGGDKAATSSKTGDDTAAGPKAQPSKPESLGTTSEKAGPAPEAGGKTTPLEGTRGSTSPTADQKDPAVTGDDKGSLPAKSVTDSNNATPQAMPTEESQATMQPGMVKQSAGNQTVGDGSKKAPTGSPAAAETTRHDKAANDDYFLFPVQQDHKLVDLNKGDMVAYVDPKDQSAAAAAAQATGRPAAALPPQRRSDKNSTASRVFVRKDGMAGLPRGLGERTRMSMARKAVQSSTRATGRGVFRKMKRREGHEVAEGRANEDEKQVKRKVRLVRRLATLLNTQRLQPGKTNATPSYWRGEKLEDAQHGKPDDAHPDKLHLFDPHDG